MSLKPKHFGAALATIYGIWLIFDYQFHFLDYVNLIIHEAGHFIFGFLGETAHFLGGTLLQILIPLLFILKFFGEEQRFAASIMGIWLGQNFLNVAVYMADTNVRALHLVGGGIHDWMWLFGKWELITKAETIAQITQYTGFAIIVLSVFAVWKIAFIDNSSKSPQI